MSSNEPTFLGIDVGTSSVKAGFVSSDGRGLLQTSAEYPTFYGQDGEVEQNAFDWWNAATRAVQTLVKQAPHLARAVQAVSVSCQAPTLFGVDRHGRPVGRGLIWMDRQAEPVCRGVLREHAEYVHHYSCNRIDPYYMLSKLVWQKQYHPQDYTRTDSYLSINGWLVYQLTGSRLMDVTNANLTQLLNVYTLNWDRGIFNRLDLDLDKMPPVVSCGTAAGIIRPELARLWGLPPQTVVASGCVDGSAAPLGLGLSAEGDVFEMSGTSSGIGVILSNPRFCPNLSLMKHVREDKWFLKGSTSCSGGALKWDRDQVDQLADPDCFQTYSLLAQESPPGAGGVLFLPYLNGERAPLWDSRLRGVCLGFSSATRKKDLLRAILEGTAYALRTILEEFPADQKQSDVILGTGGGYSSALWSQIKADVLGRTICARKTTFDAAVLGSAYIAMEAVGVPVPKPPRDTEEVLYHPDSALSSVYGRNYRQFQKAYQATRVLFHEEDEP